MKTAVSIPDKVFSDAEWLARRLKKSRSQLYSEALAEYTAKHSRTALIAAINEAYGDDDDDGLDAFAEAVSTESHQDLG